MEPFRLKLKVGPHEFEAEGDQETVERQLAVWRELIASTPLSGPALASPPPQVVGLPAVAHAHAGEGMVVVGPPPRTNADDIPRDDYDRLFDHRGRVVTLTMLPPTGPRREADAALLLLLGQKVYNAIDLVTGQQLNEGLTLSGLPVPRIDRGWGEHMDTNVTRVGSRRGVKYRLTNPGYARAREMAKELLRMTV